MAPSFKTCAGLNFFRPYFHYCLSSDHCCEDGFHIGLASTFTSLFAVHINDFRILTVIDSSLHGFIANQYNNQLPVSMSAH